MLWKQRAACVLMLGLVWASTDGRPAEKTPPYFEPLWHKRTRFIAPNDPVVADVNADGLNEVIISGSEGHLTVFTGANGKTLWSRVFEDASLKGPVVGHFWGDGSLDVAVTDSQGNVYLLNGADGRRLKRIPLQTQIPVDPTVLPPDPTPDARGFDYHPEEKDYLLVIDDESRIYCLVFGPGPKETGEKWVAPLGGVARAPASIGDVDGDYRFEVVAGVARGNGGLLNVLRGATGEPLPGSPESYAANLVTIASLANVDHTGGDEIIVIAESRESNYLVISRYNANNKVLSGMNDWRNIGKPVGDPVLVPDEPPGRWTIVVQTPGQIVLHFVDPGVAERSETIEPSFSSSIALATGGPNVPTRMIFGDELGGVCDWWVTELKKKQRFLYRDELPGKTPVLADLDGEPGAEMVLCFPNERYLRVVRFPDFGVKAGGILWQTRGGNLWRTGWFDNRYFGALEQRYKFVADSIAAHLQKAENALAGRAWKDALKESRAILDIAPHHAAARKIHRKAWVRDHVTGLLVAGLIGLIALAGVGRASFLIGVRAVGLKQASELVRAGKLEEATDLYTRLHHRFPKHPATNAALAELLIQQDRLDPEHASVFEHAHADRPGDERVLWALADCYRRSGALAARARDVYMKALAISESAAELKFLIGRSFLAEREWREGARYLGEALAEGFQDDAVYEALADAYLELRLLQPEVLPILERVRPARPNDLRFLAYLCEAYSANERFDETALECAQQALAQDPDCDPAQMLYIEILLKHGQVEGAWQRAEALYARKPQQPETLRVVSRCLITLDRRDDEAVQMLEKALVHYPNSPPIVGHLSHVYFMRNWFDPHAAEIHRRAYELTPEDDRVVEAMARLAEQEADDENVAFYLEKLLDLGRESRDIMLRLAAAYRNLGIADARARKTYEIAIEEHPDDLEYLAALGKVYIAQAETSRAAVAVLGRLYDEGVQLPGQSRQLIAALAANDEHGPLITMCDAYLEANPGDLEVKRLRASAYLAAEQVERAVEEYEQLLERGPENEQVVVDLSLAYAEAGRTDERAIALYKNALRTQPHQDALYRALGCANAERGDLQQAVGQFHAALRARKECAPEVIEQCEALLDADPSRTPLRWFLCEVLVNCGRFREAIDQLRVLYERDAESIDRILEALGHILEVDAENVHARRVRGRFLLRAGRLEEARTDLEEADRLQPDNEDTVAELRALYETMLSENEDAELRFRLGQIYHHANDLDSALRCFQKSVRDYRFENESTAEMGTIFMKKNLLDLALEEFQKLRVEDELKDTLYQLGQLYEQRGDGGGARAAYRLIFAADAGYRDVQKRFEALSGETVGDSTALDRTMILSQLSEKAKHRYKLLEEIGRGAMGIVYRAMDSELDEVVALKILPDNLSTNKDALTRFRREARSARRLSHRNIVRIHDIGEEMGRKYISMEFVEGTTLKALIRAGGGLEIPRILRYGCQILDALAYAHSIGIVHRDIKPANIMISRDDEVKITDFGIAKILESTDATAEGAIVGTPLYMSPEQVRGDPVDHRADLYSLGILLYECIEGKPPFVKGDLAYSHLHLWPDPIARGFSELNREVMRALEKRKEDRWPSAQAMLDALKAIESPDDAR